jgi:hypothetical protein
MSIYKNVAAVMAKKVVVGLSFQLFHCGRNGKKVVVGLSFQLFRFIISYFVYISPMFFWFCQVSVYLSQNCLMYIYSQEKTITHYCFTKLFISLYFAVLYFFRTN